jgi:hypothetical protein
MAENSHPYLVYTGSFDPDDGTCSIQVRDLATDGSGWTLNPQNKLRNHSPDGFSWGYSGSGPAQTALAIMVSHLADERHHADVMAALGMDGPPAAEDLDGQELHVYLALRFYQRFKAKVIAAIPMNTDWELTEEQIAQAIIDSIPAAASA